MFHSATNDSRALRCVCQHRVSGWEIKGVLRRRSHEDGDLRYDGHLQCWTAVSRVGGATDRGWFEKRRDGD